MKGKNNVVTILTKRIRQSELARAQTSIPAEGTFEAHFNENWESVCRVITHILGDQDEAEDIALEVFWRLHEQPPRQDSHIRGWLHRVAVNLGLNALRARKRRQAYEQQTYDKYAHISQEQPEAAAIRKEEQGRVREVLSMMNPRAAKLLVLRHSGLSYAEIAAALHLNPASVGKLLSRAERDFEKRYRSAEGIDASLP